MINFGILTISLYAATENSLGQMLNPRRMISDSEVIEAMMMSRNGSTQITANKLRNT